MISVYGVTPSSLHFSSTFCRMFQFESSPDFHEINNGHIFFYDGFRWLEPETTYQVTVRALPIDNEIKPKTTGVFTLPSCNEVPESYYCKLASHWKPQLLDVQPHLQAVNVTFDLAPDTYQFDKYCVRLKDAKNNMTTQTKNVVPDAEHVIKRLMNGTNTSCVSTTLGGIEPGKYVVQVQPRPSSLQVCVNTINVPVSCRKTGSNVFYVAGPTTPQTVTDGTQVGETPRAGAPYATAPLATRQNQMWLPILLGCIAGILALVLLFFMIHRSQKREQSESASKCIWKIPVTMSDPAKLSQENLQKGLDLTRLKEEAYKLQAKGQEDVSEAGDNVTSEMQQTAGRNQLEMEPLLSQHDERSLLQQQQPGDFFQNGSCSTLGCFTAEFMQVMSTTKSISSLRTIEASVYRGSQNRLQRTNSKPDLVSLWWEKCPMLSSQNPGSLRRNANSCPDMKTLGEAGNSNL
ncbi:uncharacterized protein [Amphiura filiformis]|uniref:uncharacterized protein n=1 Tax=Amphiura filiformis TaxID=82378 RepID=UPI003B22883F